MRSIVFALVIGLVLVISTSGFVWDSVKAEDSPIEAKEEVSLSLKFDVTRR